MPPETPFHRRHLPHFYPPDAVYFISSRLADSLPQSVIERAEAERRSLEPRKSAGRRKSSGLPAYIDENIWWEKIVEKGRKDAHWLADPRIASLVADSIRYRDGKDYDLIAYTIMPNHMHLVFGIGQYDVIDRPEAPPPLSGKQVSGIMMSLKRYTAREANKILGRSGPFWQDESYDHVVRDGEGLARIVEYVLDNPVKAGLAQHRHDWRWTLSKFRA